MKHSKILVVEDDPDIMRIILHTLKGAGHQVVPAYGGEDAIRKLQGQRFDLVLTDLAMPKVSGVQVIEAVKSDPDTQHTPVIAVTAYVWENLAQAAGQAGCDGYISKPFTPKQLLQELEKHLKS
jgi:CheY-like chemotaxis protein